jgi:23S rRNA pseudouridine955/2504/2580 synthase
MIRAAVIYRDDHIIALNKPPGLPTQGGSGQTRHVDGLAEALRFGLEDKPRLVHRLDKDTSGVLLLARTRAGAAALTEAFRSRETRKIYWAAVAGVPQPRMGTIRYGLVKAPGHGRGGEGEKMHCVHPDAVDATEGAKRAVTDYAGPLGAGQRVSWCALVPVTGRTHQLRAHMAEIGPPHRGRRQVRRIGAGEPRRWLGRATGRGDQPQAPPSCALADLTHPMTGARLHLTAPLPEHMARTWAALEWQRLGRARRPVRGRRMSDLRLVVFDVDGTLVDSQAHILAAMSRAFDTVDRPPPVHEAVLGIVGLSLPAAMARLSPDRPEDVPTLVEAYKAAFAQLHQTGEGVVLSPLYPGARDCLSALSAEPLTLLGVATGKSRRGLTHLIDLHDLASTFQTVQVADDHPSKPHPAMLEACLFETGVDASNAVMIGDTTYDIEMGRAAGFRTIGVSWGYHPVSALREAGADDVIDDFAALHSLLGAGLQAI